MATLPYNVSDQTLTFFARNRPYEIQRGHKHFDHIKGILTTWDAAPRAESDVDSLIALADPKESLIQASGQKLSFSGNDILYGTTALHNLWVDKILGFRDAGMPFDPIFRALEDLQLNPTPAARDRLPIFVERSKLGFLPDGRIAAFKGVRGNYNDVHSNTVNYAVGKTVSIPRAACNADPNQTCVAGLHLGAIDYIKQNGYGWGSDRRMLLCAFWPRHVVAVPTDYQGGKMRVEQLEVLDEVDRKFVDELLNNGQLIVRGYEPSPHAASAPLAPAASAEPEKPKVSGPAGEAKVGDWVRIEDDDEVTDGVYQVVAVDDDADASYRLDVKTSDGDEGVENSSVTELLKEAPVWIRAKVGDWIKFSQYSDNYVGQVTEIDATAIEEDDMRVYAVGLGFDDWVENNNIENILAEPPVVWLRVREDDTVRIEGHAFLKDGEYKVSEFDTDGGKEGSGHLVEIRVGDDDEFYIRNDLIKSIKREEEAAKGQAAAATAPVVAPSEPAWKTAKVGDTIRVTGYARFSAGTYEVEGVDIHNGGNSRLRVKNPGGNVWVDNQYVDSIVSPVAAAPVAPVVPAEPAWKRAKVGDKIVIKGSDRQADGTYEVDQVDDIDVMGRRLRVKNPGRMLWVDNTTVDSIVSDTATPAPTTDTRPIWEQVLIGDVVRIEGDSDVTDGNYTVEMTDGSLTAGPDGAGVRVEDEDGDDWWVYNKSVKAIIERDGKPFGTAAVEDTRPVWQQAEKGDVVLVEGSRWVSDGEHVVGELEPNRGIAGETYAFRSVRQNYWIEKSAIKAIVRKAGEAAVNSNEPAYKLAKVGDTIRVAKGDDHSAGEFKVTRVSKSSESDYLLAVHYEPYGTWWIKNDKVEAIVKTADGATKAA